MVPTWEKLQQEVHKRPIFEQRHGSRYQNASALCSVTSTMMFMSRQPLPKTDPSLVTRTTPSRYTEFVNFLPLGTNVTWRITTSRISKLLIWSTPLSHQDFGSFPLDIVLIQTLRVSSHVFAKYSAFIRRQGYMVNLTRLAELLRLLYHASREALFFHSWRTGIVLKIFNPWTVFRKVHLPSTKHLNTQQGDSNSQFRTITSRTYVP
ncbi:hypothetical protein CALVIDRAFT_338254 [Calocera viscosa TUFC12733]|uniref:Uncharacterized protein n=1 Tax=Calocera viscosa (strain TUFC12733) TaxID=1330018 RepID=A0A167HKQ4_CALVF|nr:hypothetical protein CALVIDRAFT_338254 [Calocera viscosa TUFC12733]